MHFRSLTRSPESGKKTSSEKNNFLLSQFPPRWTSARGGWGGGGWSISLGIPLEMSLRMSLHRLLDAFEDAFENAFEDAFEDAFDNASREPLRPL